MSGYNDHMTHLLERMNDNLSEMRRLQEGQSQTLKDLEQQLVKAHRLAGSYKWDFDLAATIGLIMLAVVIFLLWK
jgi:hypothetical protein